MCSGRRPVSSSSVRDAIEPRPPVSKAVDQERLADVVEDGHPRIQASRTGPGRPSGSADRSGRSSARESGARSTTRPSAARNRISPLVGDIARRMQRAVVVLPQPDSPTRPSVSPSRIVKLTSSTAATAPTTLRFHPRRIGNDFRRWRTSRSQRGRAHGSTASSRLYRKQLASCVGPTGRSAGTRSAQRPGMASGQRGWKGQPRGRPRGCGIEPAIVGRSVRGATVTLGIDFSSARV